MSAEQNIETARQIYEAFGRGRRSWQPLHDHGPDRARHGTITV
jgi:hypothetical protein